MKSDPDYDKVVAEIDRDWYLREYPDVRKSGIDPVDHFLQFGRGERRLLNEQGARMVEPEELPLVPFDGDRSNFGMSPNVDRSLVEDIRSSGWFDAPFYKAQAQAAGYTLEGELIAHYLQVGSVGGLQPHPGFLPLWYSDTYPDVSSSGFEALEHFVRFGEQEGRIPGPLLPDVEPNPLVSAIVSASLGAIAEVERMGPSQVTVVVDSLGVVDETIRTVKALRTLYSADAVDVIVIDRSLPDGWQTLMEQADLPLVVPASPSSPAGCAYTTALQSVDTPFVLFLESGCVLLPGSISKLVRTAQRHDAGIVGPSVIGVDGHLESCGWRVYRNGELRPVGTGGVSGHWMLSTYRSVEMVGRSGLLIETSLLEELGGLDEKLGLGNFDAADLCVRSQEHGFAVVVVPDAVVVRLSNPLPNPHQFGVVSLPLRQAQARFRSLHDEFLRERDWLGSSSSARLTAGQVRSAVIVSYLSDFASDEVVNVLQELKRLGHAVTIFAAGLDPDHKSRAIVLVRDGFEVADAARVTIQDGLAAYPDPIAVVIAMDHTVLRSAGLGRRRCKGAPPLIAWAPDLDDLASTEVLEDCDAVLIDAPTLASRRIAYVAKDPQGGPNQDWVRGLMTRLEVATTPVVGRRLRLEAQKVSDGQRDIIILPVIDWYFRFQRPQQLAAAFAGDGHRVLYVGAHFSPEDSPGYVLRDEPLKGIFLVSLTVPDPAPRLHLDSPTPLQVEHLAQSLALLSEALSVVNPIVIVDHPFWARVAEAMPGVDVVYDLMDKHDSFHQEPPQWLPDHARLLGAADLVTVTSSLLDGEARRVRDGLPIERVPNAAASELLDLPRQGHPKKAPVVGYVGALAEWFDYALIRDVARLRPEYQFEIFGGSSTPQSSVLEGLPNIRLHGEVPYDRVPSILASFDVGLIPFLITPLIEATDPVKAYEYLAAGIPVVATAMPELQRLPQDGVWMASGKRRFAKAIDQALEACLDPTRSLGWRTWAANETWEARASSMLAAVDELSPLVSVVVLTYNGLYLTQACLESLVALTQYHSWELIVVDNGSTDGTVEYLREFAEETANTRLIENGENLGFAEGNNRGICTAKGEIIVLLNNDTVVTRGWLRDLIRHFRNPDTAMVGPITDNAGNEARVIVSAPNGNRWARAIERYCGSHRAESTAVQTLAFFCVAIRASVINEVGLLDPAYGIGMFEDDDYCRRVSELGYSIRLAEDVFVHHEMSASFDKLGERKQELFKENKTTYEARWGPWLPHSYREPIVRIDG